MAHLKKTYLGPGYYNYLTWRAILIHCKLVIKRNRLLNFCNEKNNLMRKSVSLQKLSGLLHLHCKSLRFF